MCRACLDMYVSFQCFCHILFATSECLWAKHRYWRPFPSLPEIWKLVWGFCNDRLLRPRFSTASGDELREDLLWNWRLRLLNLNQIPPLNPTPCLTLLPFILLSYRFSSIEFLIVTLIQCVVLLGIWSLFLAVRKNSICRRRKPKQPTVQLSGESTYGSALVVRKHDFYFTFNCSFVPRIFDLSVDCVSVGEKSREYISQVECGKMSQWVSNSALI